MKVTRRKFVGGGIAAFTVGFAAPEFLCDLALANGAGSRNLVVLYLGGGNDSLSMLAPYTDSFYYRRRPTLAIPAGSVLQIGSDSSGKPLGLHPRLTGLWNIFNRGHLAFVQRTGYSNSSRSHMEGTDIWSSASRDSASGGWLGRYLETLPRPVDPLIGWATTGETPRTLESRLVPVANIPSAQAFIWSSPNGGGTEGLYARTAAVRIASHLPVHRPHVSFVNLSVQAAFGTMDRVVPVRDYISTLTYPNTGFALALRAVAGAIAKQVGTKVFWVQTGGYDTHSQQNTNAVNGSYYNLMATLDDGLAAFYTDLENQGLLGQTLIVQFSEFGRRVDENSSGGTDHGAASVMMLMGASVKGGIYGTAPALNPGDGSTLENNGLDVTYETDFRSVYARLIDNWLGANSVTILGGDFRNPGLAFI